MVKKIFNKIPVSNHQQNVISYC